MATALGTALLLLAYVAHSARAEGINSSGKGYVEIRRDANSTETAPDNNTETATDSESPMDTEPPSAQSYRMPGLFALNGGRPFYLERDPVTGAVDFNSRADDYIYDDEPGDPIDRKDGPIDSGIGRPNGLDPFRVHNHKYGDSKLPLISSSYANTKVQGTASNRPSRPTHATIPTPTPSYYWIRPQHASSSTVAPPPPPPPPPSPETEAPPLPGITNAYDDSNHKPDQEPVYEYDYIFDNFGSEDTDFVEKDSPTATEERQPLPTTVAVEKRPPFSATIKEGQRPPFSASIAEEKRQPLPTTITEDKRQPLPITVAEEKRQPISIIKAQDKRQPISTILADETRPQVFTVLAEEAKQPFSTVFPEEKKEPITTVVEEERRPEITTTTIEERQPVTMPTSTTTTERATTPSTTTTTTTTTPRPTTIRPTVSTTPVPRTTTTVRSVTYPRRPQERPPPVPLNVVHIPATRAPPSPGIVYGESEFTIPVTSMPLGTHFQFRPAPPPGLPKQPEANPGVNIVLTPEPKPHAPNPYGSYIAEEPFRPIFGPGEGLDEPPKIPQDTPSRLNYPVSEGTGSFFQLRPEPAQQPQSFVLEPTTSRTEVKSKPRPQWVAFPDQAPTGSNNDVEEESEESTGPFLVPSRPQLQPQPPVPSAELQPPAEPVPGAPPSGWDARPRPSPPPPQVVRPPAPQTALPKVDTIPPPWPRVKPNRPPPAPQGNPDTLPNILPQFRPNARISHGHENAHRPQNRPFFGERQPMERLQPPPPPPMRINRHDGPGVEMSDDAPFRHFPPQPPRPLVRRRTGPHVPEPSTLQMMQHATPAHGKRPVFVVYPVNTRLGAAGTDGGVVVGTRGPHLPLPPANLDSDDGLSIPEDVPLSLFGHNKHQTPLLQLAKDRVDTPILKTHGSTNHVGSQPVKTDFPYPLVRPDMLNREEDDEEEDHRVKPPSPTEYNNFPHHLPTTDVSILAEVHNSDSEKEEDNAEINIIPYLQDYMPFATKKPPIAETRMPALVSSRAPVYSPDARIVAGGKVPSYVQSVSAQVPTTAFPTQAVVGSGGSEITVSAIMHTHYSNHRPEGPVSSPSSAPPLNFQAPFLASADLGAAQWSVVGGSQAMRPGTVAKADLDREPQDVHVEPGSFDFEHFKPQLFGGFKPIYNGPEEKTQLTTERQERKLLLTS